MGPWFEPGSGSQTKWKPFTTLFEAAFFCVEIGIESRGWSSRPESHFSLSGQSATSLPLRESLTLWLLVPWYRRQIIDGDSWAHNPLVGGSSPPEPTITIEYNNLRSIDAWTISPLILGFLGRVGWKFPCMLIRPWRIPREQWNRQYWVIVPSYSTKPLRTYLLVLWSYQTQLSYHCIYQDRGSTG